MEIPEQIRRTLVLLLRELVEGPPGDAAYMLNVGDVGMLRSLDALSADAASARPTDRSSVAAHVDHVRYGLSLLNRWVGGETNPWATADWSESWKRTRVTEAEWTALRANLAREARAWIEHAGKARDLGDIALGGVFGSFAHLAYHLGAIRQLSAAAAGPPERG